MIQKDIQTNNKKWKIMLMIIKIQNKSLSRYNAVRCNTWIQCIMMCAVNETELTKRYDAKTRNVTLSSQNTSATSSDTMEVQRSWTRSSCCVRNERSTPSAWTRSCGASTSSHTRDPPPTLPPTRLFWSLMTASWAWTCRTEDSKRGRSINLQAPPWYLYIQKMIV